MQPNPKKLLEKAEIELEPIGLYDAPDTAPFEPLVAPADGRWACVFMFYKSWQKGRTLHLVPGNHGCGGASTYLLDRQIRSRESYIDFLHGEEGLKASPELMGQWIDNARHYRPQHERLLIGPLRADQYDYLKTVTFFVNPDQLSLLLTGAQYHQEWSGPPAVIAPFGAGCGLMVAPFEDLQAPQAIIGATDIAARKYLPADIMALSVTLPMFERLCSLDEDSFLGKPFWRDLKKARRRNPTGSEA